jgi:hypothetical protein
MPIHKHFGAVPTDKILVRIQEVSRGKVLNTRTFAVYGADHSAILESVETMLSEQYGNGKEEEESEEEIVVPPPTVRKARRVR